MLPFPNPSEDTCFRRGGYHTFSDTHFIILHIGKIDKLDELFPSGNTKIEGGKIAWAEVSERELWRWASVEVYFI
jgi:hypothetical protein